MPLIFANGYHGDIRLGDTIHVKFTSLSSSAVITVLAGTPVISAYPAASVTQLTAGITLTVDFDAVVGLNDVTVVASGANGYLTATNYTLVITTGTIGGVTAVGFVVGSFSIENRSPVMPTTGGRTLDVSAAGEAGIDWANIGGPTTAQNLSATNIDVDQVVASVSGAVGSVTGLTASNLDATVSSRATPAQVNTEVLDVLNVDTFVEPAQGTPAATTTLVNKIAFLYKYLRNRVTVTATTISVYGDDALTVDHKSTHSDDATTYDRGEFITGP